MPRFPVRAAALTGLATLAAAAASGCGEAARSSSASPAQPTSTSTTPATTPVVSPQPSAPATTPPADPVEPTSSGQVAAMQVAATVEACFGARPDYRLCTRPQAVSGAQLPPIVDGAPRAGEVQVVADGPRAYSVAGVDADGTRWTIRRTASGEVTRRCETPAGRACGASAWASAAG